jgi:hypothetical protein
MVRRTCITACVLAASVALFTSAGAQDPAKKKDLKLVLTKIALKKGMARLGFDLKGEIPANAVQGKFGTDTFYFLDMNGDEKLEPEVDGMMLPSVSSFVVPIPDKILLKTGQYTPEFDGMKTLTLTPEDLGSAQGYVADTSVLTEVRIRIGLRPFTIDAKACAEAEKHCDYMKANGLNVQGTIPGNPHIEIEGKPGYTPEGAAAGAAGDLARGRTDLRKSILGWYSTPYHGSSVINPAIKRVAGVSKSNVCILYFQEYGLRPTVPSLHPPDGSMGIPTALGNGEDGELPNPVPGTTNARGCGFPITVRMDGLFGELLSAELLDGAGKTVQGTFSCPMKPANAAIPTNMDCAFFIPSKPLSSNTTFKATFKFKGVEKPLTWSFTTGK